MRIVLDYNCILRDRYSGFFTYGAGLLMGLDQIKAEISDIDFVLVSGGKFKKNIGWLAGYKGGLECEESYLPVKVRYLYKWWRMFDWPDLSRFVGEFDLYQSNFHLMPPCKGRPRLVLVHDLRRYRVPQYCSDSKTIEFANAVKYGDHFIAISDATKIDLMEFFGVPADKITVIYHGGSIDRIPVEVNNDTGVLYDFGLQPGRYFVAMSSYDKRKNLDNTIESFKRSLSSLDDDVKLAIVGNVPEELRSQSGGDGRIVFTGMVPDIMPFLSGAMGLVFVSWYEGFGLPILEGMQAGTAVITSNVSSMPEVGGEAAMLVDPGDCDEIAEAMVSLANDVELREKYEKAGSERLKEFSWKKTALETVSLYRKLLS